MAFVSRALLGLLAVAFAVTTSWSADPKTKDDAKQAETMKPPAVRTLDDLNLPADAILIICDEMKKALELIPKGVLITTERFQELRRLEEEKRLKRQTDLAKPGVPTAVIISGQVERELAQLQLQYKITTNRPKMPVALGCQRASAKSASLDGHLPMFVPDPNKEDGLVVEIETPGTHELTLGLTVPIAARGTKGKERGFDIGLPKAAITRLERMRLPSELSELRVNGRAVIAKPNTEGQCQIEDILLGPADRLDFLWQAATVDRSPPLFAAEGRISVRVEEKRVVTDVDFSLQVLRGEVKQWQILLPANLVPEIKEPQDERVEQIDLPHEREPWLTIRLKKASAAPLRVAFQVTQSPAEGRVAIGPFLVLGAFRQHGTIGVSAAPEYRLTFHPDPDVSRREPSEDQSRDDLAALFYYSKQLIPAKPSQPSPALLGFDFQVVKGVVEAKVDHTLRLTEDAWRLSSRIDITPIRSGVDALEIQVPADYPYDRTVGASPAELIEDQPVLDVRRQVLIVRLARRQFRPFSVTLPAVYPAVAGAQTFSPQLPRLLQTLDRGGQLTVLLPDHQELIGRTPGGDPLPPGKRTYTWTFDRAPLRVEVAWRRYQPELRVDSVLDITLREGQSSAVQRITFHSPEMPIDSLRLREPPALRDHLRMVSGGSLGPRGVVTLDRPAKTATLVLAYALSRAKEIEETGQAGTPAKDRYLPVPLVWVADATRAESKVRVWGEGCALLADGSWDELPCETVADKDTLPLLVLRSGYPGNRLALRWGDSAAPPVSALIERVLFQTEVSEAGEQRHRARFLVSRIGRRVLEVEFHQSLAGLRWDAFLDGKRLSRIRVVDASGQASETGTVLRFDIEPELYHQAVVLDLSYEGSSSEASGPLQYILHPPVLRGGVLLGKARWEVELPPGSLGFFSGRDDRPALSWQWRGGLLTPVTRTTRADLEGWFAGAAEHGTRSPGDNETAGLVCWRSHVEPLQVWHFPRQAWLLVCSLAFLGVGLGLCFAWRGRVLFFSLLIGLSVAVTVVAVGRPGVTPVVLYGCEPGVVVFALLLTAQATSHYRQARRRRFLPGFARTGSGAIGGQAGSSQRRRIEPSTVDAPAARDSSVSKKQPVQES